MVAEWTSIGLAVSPMGHWKYSLSIGDVDFLGSFDGEAMSLAKLYCSVGHP